MKRARHILSLLVGCLPILIGAAPVPAEKAVERAEAWFARKGTQWGRRASGRARSCSEDGTNLFHLVALEGGGFVAVAADDAQPPIMGFSASDELPTPGDGNPLWDLLGGDAAMRGRDKGVASPRRGRRRGSRRYVVRDVTIARARQAAGLVVKATTSARITNESGLDDVRVSPLVQSKWDQKNVSGKATYNYYTPYNWHCGCVATALAQLMRFHSYPTASVTPRTFTCYTNEVATSLTMKGGIYDWNSMPLVPNSSITDAQREAIGRICHDAGVAMRMQYASDGSGAFPYEYDPLRNVFGFANAHSFLTDAATNSLSDSEIRTGILANLDAGYPVLLSINTSSGNAGHAILADGYGYADGTLYCHLNMGWSGSYNYWYAIPSIPTYYSFSVVNAISFNIFPDRTGELVTGRVTDTSGKPIAGAAVSASMSYRQFGRPYTVTTNVLTSAKGVYFLFAPANRSCTVTLAATYRGESTTNVMTYTSASASPTSVDYATGEYWAPRSGLVIGNSWGNDFVIAVKTFNGILCRGESKSEQPWRAKAERLLGKEDVGLGQCRQGVGRCDTPP